MTSSSSQTTSPMPPLTNTTSSESADLEMTALPLRPKSEILAEDIELPPSPQYRDQDVSPSPPILSSPRTSYFSNSSRLQSPSAFITPSRPRASSPGQTSRPLSAGGIAGMPPPMQRAHSSPGVDSSGRFIAPYSLPRRPSSPLNAGRRRSPLRSAMEDSYPGLPSWSGLNIEPNIPENEELELHSDLSHPSPISSFSNTFPRSRRRPTSPLHQSASAPVLHTRAVSPNVRGRPSGSPSLPAQKFTYEPYPMYSYSSASSMPSTPTSLRSRSPSISSLETIEDIPDAEAAAMLEEEEGGQREDGDGAERRRSSLESRGSNLRSNKERKRWSVCGAERRADFSLEPIEE